MSTRSPAELRRAAIDAGWESDALASEILLALSELDVRANGRPITPSTIIDPVQIAPVAKPPTGKTWQMWLSAAVSIVSLVVAGVSIQYASSTTKSKSEEIGRVSSDYEARLEHVRQENAVQLSKLTASLQAALQNAETVSKANAQAADLNKSAVQIYMTSFQDMLEELKTLKGESAKPAATPNSTNPAKP